MANERSSQLPGPGLQAQPDTPRRITSDRGLLRAFSSLRHRNFRLYWFGQILSWVGTAMQTVGQVWLVLELTHSPWQLGLVSALQFMPILLFSLVGGIFADRWPKRRVLLVTQAAAMSQAFLLWTLSATGTIQIWHMYVLALLLGLTNSLGQPTSSAFVVEMVGREDLSNAVALNSSLSNLARVVGPGLGGIIIAFSGITVLFLLNALSFLTVITGLALIDSHRLYSQVPQRASAEERQHIWQSLGEGMKYVWKTPAIVLMILVVGLVLLFGENFNIVLPLFATDVLHIGSTGFGFLSAAMSVGALLSSLWLAWSNLRPTISRVLFSALAFAGLEAIFAVSHIYLLSLALMASMGMTVAVFGALAITTLQTVAPDHLRGRVISVYVLFFTGSLPLGSLLTGWLTGLCGPSLGLLICALLCLLVVAGGWLWRKPAEKDSKAGSLTEETLSYKI